MVAVAEGLESESAGDAIYLHSSASPDSTSCNGHFAHHAVEWQRTFSSPAELEAECIGEGRARVRW